MMHSLESGGGSLATFNLSHRVVMITGAGGGVGRSLALAFARCGASVVANDVSSGNLDETMALGKNAPGRSISVIADISTKDGAESCITTAKETFGPIDILVNNAAVITEVKSFLELPPEAIERDIRIGLIGTMNVTRAALPDMVERKFGRVVNIASDAGRAGNARLTSYSATKGGVIAFTKALAQEVGPDGITVNAVSPGSVRAPMRDQILNDIDVRLGAEAVAQRERARLEQYPTRRIAEPEDIANAVLFFASDGASDITGQTLSVNGGFRMF